MKINQLIKLVLMTLVCVKAYAVDQSILPPIPAGTDPEQIWKQYCIGNRKSSEVPQPNYQNEKVLSAAQKLAMVSPYSFYFYSGPLYVYGLKNGKELNEVPDTFPKNIDQVKSGHKNAHTFLTVLCGEFRDRPTLIQAKVNWVNRLFTLPVIKQSATKRNLDLTKDLWSQVTANDYTPYITISRIIFDAKLSEHYQDRVGIDKNQQDQIPIEPFSVCETKYIFNNFVFNPKFKPNTSEAFDLKKYRDGYAKFVKANSCSQEDLDYFYDFRGDSNFKPNSPESNGMIWYSSAIASSCSRVNGVLKLKDKASDLASDKNICDNYFTSPFAYRWAAARAGLATWLMRDTKYDATFADTRARVDIIPNLDPFAKAFDFKVGVSAADLQEAWPVGDGTFSYYKESGEIVTINKQQYEELLAKNEATKKAADNVRSSVTELMPEWLSQQQEFWKRPDLGFNAITKNGTDTQLSFNRLRDAVNRHTDWYASGYQDKLEPKTRDQAYSPFVASSYEMSASNTFTAPGTTVNSPSDGCKHWMFVFKIKLDKWYNTQSIKDKKLVDFNQNWFDETSLGTNHLADSEHALDRLGTALEDEMDSILYLHNITVGGEPDNTCGQAQMALE